MTLAQVRAQATVPVGRCHTWPNPAGLMSVTLEDADFLYALTRLLAPDHVIETGSGMGISGRFIAEALRDNGTGRLTTYEPEPGYAALARAFLAGLPAEVITGPCPLEPLAADLVYIDSDAGRRRDEITHWLTCGHEGWVLVHDANREYDEFALGDGVLIYGQDGFWLGHGR